jgi:hypothetical protein
MTGPSQHYIPAAFLGRFSIDKNGSLRERSIWVLENGKDKAIETTCQQIGCKDNLYMLSGDCNKENPDRIDKVWAGYEQRLNSALDELSNPSQASISANIWLRVLVPFVAGLLVRGPEFGRRFESRWPSIKKIFNNPKSLKNNTNGARLMEFQRLLAPVMAARWIVMHVDGNHPIITNELGFTFYQSPDNIEPGIAIPIGEKTILGIIRTWPTHGRIILQDGGTGQWRALIEHRKLAVNNQKDFNEALARIASDFITGPTAESIELHRDSLGCENQSTEIIEEFRPKRLISIAHEFEWHRAVTAISHKSSKLKQSDLQNINWDIIAKGWSPYVILPTNLKEFPTGMILHKDKIALAMNEIPGFTDSTKNSPFILKADK